MSSEGFRGDENAQKATEAWHFGDINNFIDKSGLAAVEGKSIKGIPVTRKGLVNVAHLGGKTGLQKFVASGGRYDPADANGKRLSDYLAMASNEGGVGGAMPVPASAEGLSAVAEPAAVEGLGGAEEPKTGLNFDMKKLFASVRKKSFNCREWIKKAPRMNGDNAPFKKLWEERKNGSTRPSYPHGLMSGFPKWLLLRRFQTV